MCTLCIYAQYIFVYFFIYIKKSKSRWRAESERFASVVYSTPSNSVTIQKVDSEFSSRILNVNELMT